MHDDLIQDRDNIRGNVWKKTHDYCMPFLPTYYAILSHYYSTAVCHLKSLCCFISSCPFAVICCLTALCHVYGMLLYQLIMLSIVGHFVD